MTRRSIPYKERIIKILERADQSGMLHRTLSILLGPAHCGAGRLVKNKELQDPFIYTV